MAKLIWQVRWWSHVVVMAGSAMLTSACVREREQVSVIADASAAPDAWNIVEDRWKLEETIKNHQLIMYSNITARSDAAMRESPRTAWEGLKVASAHPPDHVVQSVCHRKAPRGSVLRQRKARSPPYPYRMRGTNARTTKYGVLLT